MIPRLIAFLAGSLTGGLIVYAVIRRVIYRKSFPHVRSHRGGR